MVDFNSSMIKSAEYNSEELKLTVEFADGSKYIYSDVPKEVCSAMLETPSVGKYFLANIKNKFKYEKL